MLLALADDRSKMVRWWVIAGAVGQRNREVLVRLSADEDQTNAGTARAALDSMRLYRRVIDAPADALAALARRMIERRLQR